MLTILWIKFTLMDSSHEQIYQSRREHHSTSQSEHFNFNTIPQRTTILAFNQIEPWFSSEIIELLLDLCCLPLKQRQKILIYQEYLETGKLHAVTILKPIELKNNLILLLKYRKSVKCDHAHYKKCTDQNGERSR